jgi:hypothetical protein
MGPKKRLRSAQKSHRGLIEFRRPSPATSGLVCGGARVADPWRYARRRLSDPSGVRSHQGSAGRALLQLGRYHFEAIGF